jgi:tetratricopeptide (TPR) repeat protein
MNFRILNIIILTAAFFSTLFASADALKTYHEANIAYQKLDYPKSIQLYEDLIKNKSESIEIYYNLGNAYFKSGDFSKAILNYERAARLNPDDEDVNFNLKIASLKVVDKIESVPEIFYKRWINNFSLMLSSDTWTWILVLFVWVLFSLAAVYLLSRTSEAKKLSFLFLILFIAITSATFLIASRSHSITNIDEKAIVMASSVYVKSSPDEKGNDLFILHEGTKVEILDKLNEWRKIRIANGSIGWMKADEMEKI